MRQHHARAGYTLVELLMVMVLSGILMSIIWAMFVKSSEVLGEVDSLSHTIDRGRFTVERLRTDLQMAGSLATVSGTDDSWVQPKDGSWRVDAIYTYSGWQDDTSVMPGDVQAANPNVSFDGLVVLGAYDNPLAFEIGNIPTSLDSATIVANSRGLHKLHVPDPFRTTQTYPVDFTVPEDLDPIKPQWATRIMRIMDPSGYIQFAKIATPLTGGDLTTTGGGNQAALVNFDPADHPPTPKTGGSPFGLDVSAESDRSYDAALLDMYWYHVRPDLEDPNNYQLVRERLCAPSVVAAAAIDYTTWDPNDHTLPDTDCPGGVPELIILTDNVVDFQFWFDCANAYLQPQTNSTYAFNWLAPDNAGTCMDPNINNTELARTLHVRLSLRPKSERPDIRHYQFEDAASNTCLPASPAACDANAFPGERLRTFDIVPGFTGAAPVVTMQSDIVLPNFTFR